MNFQSKFFTEFTTRIEKNTLKKLDMSISNVKDTLS